MHDPAPEHLLAIVEPTRGGDATIDLARTTAARGGTVTVLLLVTDRVRRDIADYARGEDLSLGEAEAAALGQLVDDCRARIGAEVPITIAFSGAFGVDLRRHVTAQTTAVAVPDGLVHPRVRRRLEARTGLNVLEVGAAPRLAA